MFRALIPALLAAAVACAQTAVDPARLGELLGMIESREAGTLRCEVAGLAPVLDFRLRFQAAYSVRVPMAQFTGPGHKLSVLVRVRPEAGGAPVYLVAQFPVPDTRPAPQSLEVGGGYAIGTGRYSARSLVYDETGRMCHHEWAVDAHLGPGETRISVSMPADTVAESSAARAPAPAGEPKLNSLTVLLDAAPFDTRRSTLAANDVATLAGALASLLELAPARRVRLVVFNLDLQKELLHQDTFTGAGIGRVEDALKSLQVAAVDYRVLQDHEGYLRLLAGMVNRELRSEPPPDAVVFLSPRVKYHDKVPAEMIEMPAGKPRFYLVQFRPLPRVMPSPDIGGRGFPPAVASRLGSAGGRGGRGPGGPVGGPQTDYPDTLSSLISRLKGKSFLVHSPADFAKAVGRIAQAAAKP